MRLAKIYLLLIVLLGAACGGAQTAVEESTVDSSEMMADQAAMPEDAMEDEMAMDEHEEGMAELEESMEEMEAAEDTAVMADLPAWMSVALTDVRSGETFTLADFAGKTVFVEPMATWCTNCRRQLTNVSQAKARLNDQDDVVFVALSVETNISDTDLADYTEQTGFFWHFAVASPEMIVSLVDTFGQSITNPPSTPHFIIRPDGSTTELSTGFEGPDEIIENIQAESQS